MAHQNELQAPGTAIRQQPQFLQYVIAQELGLIDDYRDPFLLAAKRQQSIQRLEVIQLRRSGGVKLHLSEDYLHYFQERELGVLYVCYPDPLEIALQQGIYEGSLPGPGLARQQGQASQFPRQSRFERSEAFKMSWAKIDRAVR